MAFTEQNSVEYYIIQKLTSTNLNETRQPTTGYVAEPIAPYGKYHWTYKPSNALDRTTSDVLIESALKAALIRLNPRIKAHPDFADDVIRKLRTIILSENHVGLVRANETFANWLRGEETMPFGKDGAHVTIRLIDFEDYGQNTFWLTNQLVVRGAETKIPDIVGYVNGLPLIVGEAKTPVRPSVTWFDGATDIYEVYEKAIPQLFVPNVLSFSTEGKALFIGAVRTPLSFWSPWRLEHHKDELTQLVGLQDVGKQLTHLMDPSVFLDILQYYSIYATNNEKKKIKVVCRYQQYEGANLLVKRANEGKIKKGLIWHFQGSGKSLLMLFAAQKLRKQKRLNNPTVLIVVDRIDLDTQITATFNAADIKNTVTTDNIKELHDLMEKDSRKIIITMIHKFKDAYPDMNTRHNIIVMVDEAHRTQEGNLGRLMRLSLPNAFLFGLTGTPVNKSDKNTFWAFGAEEDKGGYMSRYTFQESIRDQATLPLHFEPRLPDYHIDKDKLDIAFKELAIDLSAEDLNTLSKKAANMAVFLKSPERIATIVKDIHAHYTQHVAPEGFKAMIVTPDREACILYKAALDTYLPTDASAVVISTTANDSKAFKDLWSMDKDKQEKTVELFNDKESDLKLLIVTAKLLTGFDAPILQTMYLDKSLKDHTLLQAICRTNRLYPNKSFGRIVDYFGVFDDTAKALAYDEETFQNVITNLQTLRDKLPELMAKALQHFADIDRTVAGFEGLEAAQDCLNTNEKRDAFALDYAPLSKVWEALSPDNVLNAYQVDYKWLSQVYLSVKPSSNDNGRLLWHILGAQTTALIHTHLHVKGIHKDMEEIVLDANLIEELMTQGDTSKNDKLLNLLRGRLGNHPNNATFKQLSERLEALRLKAEQGLLKSIDLLKQMCEVVTDMLQAERDMVSVPVRKTAKAALTELFLEMKTDKTPAIVERIVTDIDGIVHLVRFDGWQASDTGEKLIQKNLRFILRVKYQIKDEELYKKAYSYIKE